MTLLFVLFVHNLERGIFDLPAGRLLGGFAAVRWLTAARSLTARRRLMSCLSLGTRLTCRRSLVHDARCFVPYVVQKFDLRFDVGSIAALHRSVERVRCGLHFALHSR